MMLQRLLEILLWVGELTTGKIKVSKNLSREDSVYYNHLCDSSYWNTGFRLSLKLEDMSIFYIDGF